MAEIIEGTVGILAGNGRGLKLAVAGDEADETGWLNYSKHLQGPKPVKGQWVRLTVAGDWIQKIEPLDDDRRRRAREAVAAAGHQLATAADLVDPDERVEITPDGRRAAAAIAATTRLAIRQTCVQAAAQALTVRVGRSESTPAGLALDLLQLAEDLERWILAAGR